MHSTGRLWLALGLAFLLPIAALPASAARSGGQRQRHARTRHDAERALDDSAERVQDTERPDPVTLTLAMSETRAAAIGEAARRYADTEDCEALAAFFSLVGLVREHGRAPRCARPDDGNADVAEPALLHGAC